LDTFLESIDTFDATEEYAFYFKYIGASRMKANEIKIINKTTEEVVYNAISVLLDKKQVVPANTLKNGLEYIVQMRVKDNDNIWHDWSSKATFLCLRKPKVIFDTIDEKNYVYNNDLLMTAIYTQEQGERVDTYQFVLMNENKIIVKEFPVRIPEEKNPNVFTERITDLVKGQTYNIAIRIKTQHELSLFFYQEFMPQYIAPTVSGIVNAMNQDDSGQVLIQSFLKQILGSQAKPYVLNNEHTADEIEFEYNFINHEWVVIPKDKPLKYQRLGMGLATDWVAKMWCKNIPNGTMFELSDKDGKGVHIKFIKHDNYITCEKTLGKVKSRVRSNVVEGLGLNNFYLYVKMVEFRVMIYIEKGGAPD
jgi:hypothetical protein